MSILRVTCAALGVAFSMAGLLATSAQAAPNPAPPPITVHAGSPIPGGRRPVITNDTDWVPITTVLEVGGGACGQGIIEGYPKNGDPGSRQQRVITYRNGDVVTLLRGSVTLSVGWQWDGWLPEPVRNPYVDVPVSGTVTQIDYASGASYINRSAGSIVAAHTSPDAASPEPAMFAKAGLRSFYVLQKGTLDEYVGARGKPAVLVKRGSPTFVNLCDLTGYTKDPTHLVLVYTSYGIGGPL